MDDLLLSPLAENMRNRGRKESEDIGSEVGAEFTGKPKDDQEEVRLTLATMLTDDKQRSMLDRLMKSKLNPITTKISNYCLSRMIYYLSTVSSHFMNSIVFMLYGMIN